MVIWLRLIMMMLWSASAFAMRAPAPVRGELDLTHHDFNHEPLVDLDGEWEFYWSRLVEPQQCASERREKAPLLGQFPQTWAGHEAGGQKLTAEGQATYHLLVRLPPHLTQIGIKLPYFYGWYRLFINGQLVREGGRYSTPGRPTSSEGSGFYAFQALDDPLIHIVVQTASYQTAYGGTAESMVLGLPDAIAAVQSHTTGFDCFIVSAIFFMAIYHGALFHIRRSDKSTLYFSLFCFLIALRALAVGEGKIIHTMLGVPALFAWRIEIITYYMATPTLTAFICTLYPEETKRRFLKSIFWLGALCSLVAMLAPSTIFSYTLPPFQLCTVGLISVYLVALLRAAHRGREGANIFLIGFSVLAGLSVVEIVALRFSVNMPRVSSVGLYLFIFFQAALLAKRFNNAFRQIEQNEKRITRLNSDLKEQERVRTMFFHNTSHELRTPLHGILAFGKMIRTGAYGTTSPKIAGQIEKIEKLAESLMVQVNTILDLAKSRKGEMKLIPSIVPLDEIVEESSLIGEGLLIHAGQTTFTTFRKWEALDRPTIIGDREKIIAIIRNLLGNAFKFRDPKRINQVTLHLAALADGSLSIMIYDTGIGIDALDHQTIFEEFRQLQGDAGRRYEGTGLGLAMVKDLVALMGGRIELESTPGQGSCFKVFIPPGDATPALFNQTKAALNEPQPDAPVDADESRAKTTFLASPSQSAATLADKSCFAILVVDDNRINCEVINDILSLHGYPVSSAFGGQEALEIMRQRTVDLVLLDFMMPEFSGEDVIKAMKEDAALAQIPVIILTARASHEDRLMGLGIGADDYLAKPVMAEELLLRVNNTLSRLQLAKSSAQRKMLESSLAEAQKVHSSLGSDGTTIPGVQIASFYQSAQMAGGDWFGLNYDHKKNRLYLLIGDVSGHDMLSALVTVASAGSFKGAMALIKELGEGLSMSQCLSLLAAILNDSVCDSGRHAGKAMSIAIVGIELATGEVAYLNAGHTPLLHVQRGSVVVHLTPANPLGLVPSPEVACKRLLLESGDGLFVYTDGLTDNEGPDGRKLSMRVVRQILEEEKNPETIKSHILENCRLIWQTRIARDDCSFIYLRWENKKSLQPSGETADNAARIAAR